MNRRTPICIATLLFLLAPAGVFIRASDPAPVAEVGPNRALFREGRFVYQKNCIPCHGRFGEADGELVKDWTVLPRDFRKAIFKYRSTPYGKLPTDDDLKRTIRRGVSGTAMPVFDKLPEGELEAVIEYVKFFSPEWKKPENYAAPVPLEPRPDWFEEAALQRTQAAVGRVLFRGTCAACHGNEADGHGDASAGLRDSEGRPIQPADLRGPRKSGPEPEDLYRTIMTGINGTPMMGFQGALKPEEAWQIVAYLMSLKPSEG